MPACGAPPRALAHEARALDRQLFGSTTQQVIREALVLSSRSAAERLSPLPPLTFVPSVTSRRRPFNFGGAGIVDLEHTVAERGLRLVADRPFRERNDPMKAAKFVRSGSSPRALPRAPVYARPG